MLRKKEPTWDLSFIPTLLDTIVMMNQRLVDEQQNALNLLASCRRGRYWYDDDIEEEQDRLNDNIKKCRERKQIYQDLLVDFAEEQTKKDELK